MKTLRKYWLQLALSLVVLVYAIGHAGGYWHSGALSRLDLWLYDQRMHATMPGGTDPRVVIVDLDEKSLAKEGHWPWPRPIIAKLVSQLTDHYKAAVVGFDVVFAEKDESSGLSVLKQLAGKELHEDKAFLSEMPALEQRLNYDALFADSLKNKPVVLGYYFNALPDTVPSGELPKPVLTAGIFRGRAVAPLRESSYGGNLSILTAQARTAGHFNQEPDADGVIRRVPLILEYDHQYYEALSLAMVRSYLGFPPIEPLYGANPLKSYEPLEWLKVGSKVIPVDDSLRTLVAFRGPRGSFRYVSAADVIDGTVSPGVIEGRMVLIGTTAPGLLDLRTVPVDTVYPGVEVHANLIVSMMENSLPAAPGYLQGAEMVMLFVVGISLMFALVRLNPLPGTIVCFGVGFAIIVGDFALWKYSRLALPLAAMLSTITLMYGISMAYGYFFEARNKKQMTSLFGQYVPPELVEKMSEQPEKYSMEAQSRELTVLFSDVRGFTAISESMDPKELRELINEFLTTLSEVIRAKYLGTIDKYMGDCVMAFWGAPIQDPDHAKNAVLAGMEMQRAMAELAPKLRARGWPEIHIGVGVNTGRVAVGDMGSQIRKAYTVMGDAVNLASRLESITKQYGVGMIAGSNTRAAAKDAVVFRELDCIRVKGKDEPETIYEPVGAVGSVDKDALKTVDLFHQVLKYYRAQNWDMAELQLINLKNQSPDAKLYQVYLDRIAGWRKNPPPPDWDGVFTYETK